MSDDSSRTPPFCNRNGAVLNRCVLFPSLYICLKRFFEITMVNVTRHRAASAIRTSELTDWIGKVKVKKRSFKRKNLFIDAVLTNALVRAQELLRAKQQERRMKWLEVRKSTMGTTTTPQEACAPPPPRPPSTPIVLEELSSLDDFMYKLSLIKVPVQR